MPYWHRSGMTRGKHYVHAEISVMPFGKDVQLGMSREVALAFEAISSVKGVRTVLTPMGTQVEADSVEQILDAISAAHKALRSAGVKRTISTVRIDERRDKKQSLEDRVEAVKKSLEERQS